MAHALIPELILRDPLAGMAMLREVFGFEDAGDGRLAFGEQRLIVTQGEPDRARGVVDHLALSVPDVDAALAACLAGGARLSVETPKGAGDIPEFGNMGMRYVFLEGPEGAQIEFMAALDPTGRRQRGHDHIGVACADLGATRAFLLGQGLTERAATVLERPGGPVEVSFLAWGDGIIEAFSTPARRAAGALTGTGSWRLRAEGLSHLIGPEGLEILPF